MIKYFELLNNKVVCADVNAEGKWVNPMYYFFITEKGRQVPYYQYIHLYGDFIPNEVHEPFNAFHIITSYAASPEQCSAYNGAVNRIIEMYHKMQSGIIDPKSQEGMATLHSIKSNKMKQ